MRTQTIHQRRNSWINMPNLSVGAVPYYREALRRAQGEFPVAPEEPSKVPWLLAGAAALYLVYRKMR